MKGGKNALLAYLILVIGIVIWQASSLTLKLRAVSNTSIAPQIAGVNTVKLRLKEPPTLPPYPVVTQKVPNFAARHYVLYDVASNKVLVQQDADRAVPLASTSKIMTALLTIRNGTADDIATVQPKAAAMIGSTAGLRANEQLSIDDLLYGALLQSGNDAAYSLAYYLGSRSVGDDSTVSYDTAIEHFVQMMNQEAKNLNLLSLSFEDPSGLSDKNLGSAKDMARLASIALKDETFKSYVSTPTRTITSQDGALVHDLKNSNRLVGEWAYEGAIGVKTGFTPKAGHNLVAAATRNGHTLIAVVFNTYSGTVTASAEVARDLLDFGWNAVNWR